MREQRAAAIAEQLAAYAYAWRDAPADDAARSRGRTTARQAEIVARLRRVSAAALAGGALHMWRAYAERKLLIRRAAFGPLLAAWRALAQDRRVARLRAMWALAVRQRLARAWRAWRAAAQERARDDDARLYHETQARAAPRRATALPRRALACERVRRGACSRPTPPPLPPVQSGHVSSIPSY